ncbi:DUF2950 domain-containing protein [Methylobacter sp.]|uniref:DUF2950 domain-containing protein n=1 Tax=Methylobacter sp. TaxID=2051955 RepID=UPI003DA20F5D
MISFKFRHTLSACLFATLALFLSAVSAADSADGAAGQSFASPEEALKVLVNAVHDGSSEKISAIFGSKYAQNFSSGDATEDNNNRMDFLKMAEEKSSVEMEGADKAVLHFGKDDWAFPVPVAKSGDQWQFDVAQGEKEILNRRIGRNELQALGVIQAYVEAQFEYAASDRDGDEVSEFAAKLRSEPGKYDGLFWEAAPGQPESPLGPLVAQAKAEGYSRKSAAGTPTPYHGYLYKILTQQGSHAPGGKYSYVINGNMIAGFGLVAFPAAYGSSGIMTFIVNHQGKIYQKNLGPKTAKTAMAMKIYDPDASWQLVNTNPAL